MSQRHPVAPLVSLPPGTGKAFTVAGLNLAFFNVGGRVFAIDDLCPHRGASLAEGSLNGTPVVCPEDVQSYPVFVNGDSIEVEL